MQADNRYQAQVFIMLEKSNVANRGYRSPKDNTQDQNKLLLLLTEVTPQWEIGQKQ